ncbi:hypothetical protein SAMN06296952_2130 [Oscillospiraceae bacterium]|nr:hypothetical protein SAMN06296952_2130 [Oscillospiraceae bacterium]
MTKSILKRILCGILAVLCAVVFFIPPRNVKALSDPIDEIELYSISVSITDTGSMNVDYLITWKVLDDKKEGPLTWVKIGVPTGDVDHIRATSDNIKKAKFYREESDTFIRVDFKDEYHAGDEVTFSFSCVMYNQWRNNGNTATYSFTPGWFDEIAVDNYVIKWKADKVNLVRPACPASGGFYVWTGALDLGDKVTVDITYDRSDFNFQRHDVLRWDSEVLSAFARPIAILVLSVVMVFVRIKFGDKYDDGDGGYFGGRHFHGGGGCACACAYACACAGGGRAGCSAKDFYGTKLSSSRVRARLKKELKEDA